MIEMTKMSDLIVQYFKNIGTIFRSVFLFYSIFYENVIRNEFVRKRYYILFVMKTKWMRYETMMHDDH